MMTTYAPPTNGPGNLLVPGDAWELFKAVVWVCGPRTVFFEAAYVLHLPKKRLDNGDYMICTTAADLLLIVAYSQRGTHRAQRVNSTNA